jgi:gliding motility-associated-like protein
LKAPGGFTNYQWQDGSNGNTYTATQQGLYWLHATAANGCISKDSLIVKSVYPLPVNFLSATADICEGKNLQLNAIGTWPSYLWFNNNNTSSVTVDAAGKYWLRVTSADGCSATDTIIVNNVTDCSNAIHFPNAFTPNNDGNNDTWKPVIRGVPVNYKLSIYNRFGEKLFETTDYKQAWDGSFNNKRQAPDTFVWYCIYQFAGDAAKIEKGPLILVR